MNITKQTSIMEIKDFFHNTFPFLKLEIYKEGLKKSDEFIKMETLPNESLLGDINDEHINSQLNFDNQMEVGKFELMMFLNYKLYVQVFRQSSGLWLQTSSTDHWSLEKQNAKGEHSMNKQDTPPLNITDFDLI